MDTLLANAGAVTLMWTIVTCVFVFAMLIAEEIMDWRYRRRQKRRALRIMRRL